MDTRPLRAAASFFVVAALSTACTSAVTPQPEKPGSRPATSASVPPPSPGPLKLTVSGVIRGATTTAPLVTSEVLHSGQRLYLVLRATERANAYVAYCDSAGKLTVYPRQGALAVGPDRDTRVPETADFIVDGNVGVETIFVIASNEPLHVADPNLSRALVSAAAHAKETPCAPELNMTTEESRRAAGLPAGASAAAEPSPASVASAALPTSELGTAPTPTTNAGAAGAPRKTTTGSPQKSSSNGAGASARLPTVPNRYVPRGLIVEEQADAAVSVEPDSSGIAIFALTLKHEP
jgi:hypothetical protein